VKNADGEKKRLYRSRGDKVLGGVCGGIAEYFNVDPILIRLFFILMFFAEGAGLLAYIIAWIIIPLQPSIEAESGAAGEGESEAEFSEADEEEFSAEEDRSSRGRGRVRQRYLGIFFVILGAFFLLDIWFPAIYFRPFWPLIFVIIGVFLLIRGVDFGGR